MATPKSYKEIFEDMPKQRIKYAISAPLPPAPIKKTLTQDQVDKQKQQFKEMMALVNSQRCPLCNSQLDGGVYYSHANVYCCFSGEAEYKANYAFGLNEPNSSSSTIYCTFFAYEIYHEYISPSHYVNIINQLDLNLNQPYRNREKKTLLKYNGIKLFFDKKLDEKSILKKIKLYASLG